ncbi:hypothetical protein V8E52_000599 [Russula decolorans]
MYRNCGGALGLDEKRPVIWAYHKIAHISVEEGVYRLGADFAEAKYKSVVWTLVDSDNGFINDFTQHNILFFVIYATSPAAERWKHLTKTVSETVSVQFVVTNPWAQSEIHQAARLHERCPASEIIDDTYDRFGPNSSPLLRHSIYYIWWLGSISIEL